MTSSLGLVLAAVLGAPLFCVIAASALLGFGASGMDLDLVVLEFNRLVDTPVLVSIPLFTFAGYLLSESQAPQRLVRLSRAALGWLPGGTAIVALAVCAIFTALTGASGVTIIAVGALLLPALRSDRYREGFSLGLVTTSGSLGLLLPPAIPLILYGVVSQTSIDRLFAAGIVPGLAMVLVLALYSGWRGWAQDVPRQAFAWRELGGALRAIAWSCRCR